MKCSRAATLFGAGPTSDRLTLRPPGGLSHFCVVDESTELTVGRCARRRSPLGWRAYGIAVRPFDRRPVQGLRGKGFH